MQSLPADLFEWTPAQLRSFFEQNKHLDEPTLITLVRRFVDIVSAEDNVLYLESPIHVVGDIHGQILDLFELFLKANMWDKFSPTMTEKFLFLGDYVDRGYQSLETFAFLAFLKVKYPKNVFLLRGNHESRQVNQMYGLFNDCQTIYGHSGIWFFCNDAFDRLPIAAVVDEKVFCVHGGLSPKLKTVEKIAMIARNNEIPQEGPFADCCWSDPFEVDEFTPNRRGAGFDFGEKQVDQFLKINGFRLIARSHQLATQGFEYRFNEKLVTVWSAPNYMYRSGNDATYMLLESPTAKEEFVKFDKNYRSDQKPEEFVLDYFA